MKGTAESVKVLAHVRLLEEIRATLARLESEAEATRRAGFGNAACAIEHAVAEVRKTMGDAKLLRRSA